MFVCVNMVGRSRVGLSCAYERITALLPNRMEIIPLLIVSESIVDHQVRTWIAGHPIRLISAARCRVHGSEANLHAVDVRAHAQALVDLKSLVWVSNTLGRVADG